MAKDDRERTQARMDKQTKATQDARSGKADRDAANKAASTSSLVYWVEGVYQTVRHGPANLPPC